jgi:hypothetical protein
MKPYIKITGVIACFLVYACSDYLEPYPDGNRTEDDLWKYQEMVQGLIGQAYDYTPPTNYDNNEGAYMDCATDNAVSTSTTRDIRKLAVGSITVNQDPFLTYWIRNYRGIYLVNTFLKDRKGFNTRFLVVPKLDSLVRYRLQGEAFALRAWFHWDLLQKFGGKSLDGRLLGIPIVTEPALVTDKVNLERNTYDECVQQILADCDSAYKYLPIAHRDFLVEDLNTQRAYAGSRYFRRMEGIIARAIQANVCLTWASPQFNPGNDITRWQKAARYAKEVIDFKLNVDNVANGFSPSVPVNWFNPNFPGGVWISRYSTNSNMERMFYPGGFQGNGTMGATQELVNAFPMANGYPIDHPNANYNPQNPFAGRDPRLYNTLFHNTAQAKRNETGATMYTFETWENGGKDAPGLRADNSRTGYYIKKFVYMGLNFSDATVVSQPHSRFTIRWAHMLLAFAEAANQDVGPANNSKYGMSAKEAIGLLRSRTVRTGVNGISPDPYLNEVATLGKDEFDTFIRNERRIETCFEGMRFYDLRRWYTSVNDLNKPVHGVKVVRNADNTFSYTPVEVENRSFSSPFLPIPYDEVLRMSNLVQNEGWDSWK